MVGAPNWPASSMIRDECHGPVALRGRGCQGQAVQHPAGARADGRQFQAVWSSNLATRRGSASIADGGKISIASKPNSAAVWHAAVRSSQNTNGPPRLWNQADGDG